MIEIQDKVVDKNGVVLKVGDTVKYEGHTYTVYRHEMFGVVLWKILDKRGGYVMRDDGVPIPDLEKI